MTAELLKEISAAKAMSDDEIDTSDLPERLDWSNAQVGKFYKPIKTQVSLRVDADILNWFKEKGDQYSSLMNQALRAYVIASENTSKHKRKTKKLAR
jgi:uncharacterized protein (DUF4415 family)